MQNKFNRFLAMIVMVAMLLSLLPALAFAVNPVESEQDIWAEIFSYENKHIVPKRKASVGADDYAALSGSIAELVISSDDYAEGTCTYDGTDSTFFWKTKDGTACIYSPRLRFQMRQTEVGASDGGGVIAKSFAKRGGNPNAVGVSLFQPYYGIDDNFGDEYPDVCYGIAETTAGWLNIYRQNSATIDAIAGALEESAVVVFDSHGDTNSYDPEFADTSYLCLQSGVGITAEDQIEAIAPDGMVYYHACYGGYNQDDPDMEYYLVDGTAIANHMDRNAPNSFVWSAICLGAASEGLSAPLRQKGVEVFYGYSQSVTFEGDLCYAYSFWDEMGYGSTVAEAASYMKDYCGDYDPYYYDWGIQYGDEAYPIFVSSEDPYPGQMYVNAYQEVHSTWRLEPSNEVPAVTITFSVDGNTDVIAPMTGENITLPTVSNDSFVGWSVSNILWATNIMPTIYPAGSSFTSNDSMTLFAVYSSINEFGTILYAATPPHVCSFPEEGVVTPPTCTTPGYTIYTCDCGNTVLQDEVPALGHDWESGVCTRCDATEQGDSADEVTIIDAGRSLSLSEMVYINHYSSIEGIDSSYISNNGGLLVWYDEISEDGAVIGTQDYRKDGLLAKTVNGETLFAQQTGGIAAKAYTDKLYLRTYLRLEDGSYVYGELIPYSVKDYCVDRLANSENETLITTLSALLRYGEAAQLYFGYHTDNLATANVTLPEEPAWDASWMPSLDGFTSDLQDTGDVFKNGTSVSLDGEIHLNLYFSNTGDWTAEGAVLQVWENNAQALTTENCNTITMIRYGDEWAAQTAGIFAKSLGKTIYVRAVLTDAEGTEHCSEIIPCSVEAYAKDRIDHSGNVKMVNLAKYLVAYGWCTAELFQ